MAFEEDGMVCVGNQQGEGRAQGRVCHAEGIDFAGLEAFQSHRAPEERGLLEEKTLWSKQGVGRPLPRYLGG